MRCRRWGSPFQRSAVFNRRTWPLVHLTICSLRIRWSKNHTSRQRKTPAMPATQHRSSFDSISYGSGISSIGWIGDELGVKPKLEFTGGEWGWIGDNPFIYLDTKR